MSLLEDLEQEAQKRKATAEDAQQRKLAREEFFKTQVEPGMRALGEYLEKLVASLKILKPVKLWRYTLPGYGEVVANSDLGYELVQTEQPDSREIRLGLSCAVVPEECPLVEVEGANIKTLAGTFQRYHLSGQMQETKKEANGELISAKFRARGNIAVAATFNADADSGAVKMSFVNFDSFGTAQKTVPVEQLNDSLFDDIGRYLTREENGLLREALPEDYRAQLRSAVERNKVKKRWEFKIASRRATDLEALKRQHGSDQSLFGRLRTLVKKDR